MRKYVVTSAGGIGNQMLQYSLFLYLKSQNYRCTFYKKPEHMNENHGFDIDSIFESIVINKKNRIELNIYIIFFEFIRKIEGFITKRLKIKNNNILSKSLPIQIVNFPNWANYTFLKYIDELLHKTFKFSDFVSEENIKTNNLINGMNSVSIHIRRGDYINNSKWRSILGDICDLDYYSKSIKLINESVKKPVFFIFSDDIEWVKENLILDNCFFIDSNSNNLSYIDMQLMASCKHNIIANSTFSLIAAWLNNNPEKIVIGPSKWRNYFEDKTALLFMENKWKIIDINRPNISIICHFELSKNELSTILNQTYSDFEILSLFSLDNNKSDDRFKNLLSDTVSGNHVFIIERESLINFLDRKYLEKLLIESYN